jgi:hypothetical protein
MNVRPDRGRLQSLCALLVSVLATATLLFPSSSAAVPKLRFQTDVKGDIIAIGNALAQECRAMDTLGQAVPPPVVGMVGSCGDPLTIGDSSPDVLWRAEDTMARADNTLMIDQARSSAMLKLPQGAQVVYARLYWGGNLGEDVALAGSSVTLRRSVASR